MVAASQNFRRTAALSAAFMLSGLAMVPATGQRLAADVDAALTAVGSAVVKIIVQERAGAGAEAETAVQRSGGSVTRPLPIVDGFAATVPGAAIADLARLHTVRAITLDRRVRLLGNDSKGNTPRSVFRKTTRVDALNNAGYDGTGVTVAVLDTGIADVADVAGRVLPVYDDVTMTYAPCVNLSGESDCRDSYGHGTFMAGLIAGSGASSGGTWKGAAPNANLVSVKLAGRDGSFDVSTALAAIQWTVSFKDRYNIRVANLSFGTDGTQSYRTDPLNYAVERAWDAGIVVVVSASNRGPAAGTISKPGDDPLVITVGATDDRGTNGLNDDELPDFSGRGPTTADGLAKPDIAAPGAHVISLRAPGSAVDDAFPVFVDGSYRKGSGTSMAAAVVSGVVASMLEARPTWSPNRVKYALAATARSAASTDTMAVGAGVPDANAAVDAPAGEANAGVERSNGTGSLDASRGSLHVQTDDPLATVVQGALTTQLLLYDPVAYAGAQWDGARWYGETWDGARWYGARWYGARWYGARWYGSTWSGARWYGGEASGARWYGEGLSGSDWYGAWE